MRMKNSSEKPHKLYKFQEGNFWLSFLGPVAGKVFHLNKLASLYRTETQLMKPVLYSV